MILVALLARAAGREIDGLSSLALASALLVAAVPPLAMDLSFQLSVLATAGLLALGPPIARVLPGPRLLAKGLGVSAGAYLATAPSLAIAFGRAAPVALAANVAAGVLCAASLAAGAAVLALGEIPIAGPWAIACANGSVDALVAVSRAAAAVPGGHFRVAAPSAWLVTLDAALVAISVVLPRGRARRRIASFLAFVTITLHLGPPPCEGGPTRLEVLDVGQGLSVLLRLGNETILVDAGPGEPGRFDAGERLVVPAVLARGGRRVSILALSHGHADHIGGAPAVLEDLDVGEVWVPAGAENDLGMRRVIDLAHERGVAVRRMRGGRTRRTRRLEPRRVPSRRRRPARADQRPVSRAQARVAGGRHRAPPG
jgi:competence protein ComEC